MATQARGAFRALKGSIESVYGTQKTSGYITFPFNEHTIGSQEAEIDPQTITGTRYDVEPAYGNISVGGNITVPLDFANIGFWLYMALGGYSKAGAGPYTHTYTVANTIPSMSIEEGLTDISKFRQFTGVMVNSFNLSVSPNSEMVVSMDVAGKEEKALASTTIDATPKTYTFGRFNAKDATLKMGLTSGSLATIGTITSLNLNISNNLFLDNYVIGGGGFLHSALPTGFSVTGDYTVLFDDTDGVNAYNYAYGNNERALELTFTNGTNSLVFSVYEFKVGRTPLTVSGKSPITLSHSFRGYYQDNVNGYPMKVVLTNSLNDSYNSGSLEP